MVKEDERYTNLLGETGSSPIELFWDLVEDIYEELYAIRKKIESELKVNDAVG